MFLPKAKHFAVLFPAFDDELVSTDVSRYVEDPGFGYKDFARRGEDHLPTFRAQVPSLKSTFNSKNVYISHYRA